MRRALAIAEGGRYTVSPNPMVGCVIAEGESVLGEGYHRRAGAPHAELEALRACTASPRGATLYTTLEPCCHQGRTPPCTDAIIEAGLSRVVIAAGDPHDVVNGGGIERLRAAGITVVTGVLEQEARRQNEKFLYAVTHHSPFVLLKAGMTLDGKLATVDRQSQWITTEEAREKSLALREEYDAILIGSGTVRADNPRLTRRLGLAGGRAWTRVVLDGTAEVPREAQILSDGGQTILFTSNTKAEARGGIDLVPIDGRADLGFVLGELHARGIQSLIVEGGAQVLSEFIRRQLWQKMILFVAPMFVGGGEAPSIFDDDGVRRLTEAYRFRFDRVEQAGGDLMITAYPS